MATGEDVPSGWTKTQLPDTMQRSLSSVFGLTADIWFVFEAGVTGMNVLEPVLYYAFVEASLAL